MKPPREYVHAQLVEVADFILHADGDSLRFAFELVSTCGCWHCQALVKHCSPPRALWLYTIHSGILYPPYKPFYDTSLN